MEESCLLVRAVSFWGLQGAAASFSVDARPYRTTKQTHVTVRTSANAQTELRSTAYVLKRFGTLVSSDRMRQKSTCSASHCDSALLLVLIPQTKEFKKTNQPSALSRRLYKAMPLRRGEWHTATISWYDVHFDYTHAHTVANHQRSLQDFVLCYFFFWGHFHERKKCCLIEIEIR